MKDNITKAIRGKANHRVWMIGLCFVCFLLNLLGVRVARALNLPIYLDSVGCLLAAMLGGYLPGVTVGFLGNAVNGLMDADSAFYGVVSVLIAVTASWFAQQGSYKRFPRVLLPICVFGLIGGSLGSLITGLLYGVELGSGVSGPVALFAYEHGISNIYLAQLAGDVATDLLDKAVCVLLVLLAMRLLPESIQEKLNYHHWKQTAKTRKESLPKTRCRVMSLKTKILALIAAAILIIVLVVTGITFGQYKKSFFEGQQALGEGVLEIVKSYIDPDMVDAYLERGEAVEGYSDIEQKLSSLMLNSEEVEYIYIYRILPDGCHVVFDPDTPELAGGDPGDVVPFDDAFADFLPDLLAGKEIEPVVSNETYGYLLTMYEPIYNAQGECQCYAAVDISMPRLLAITRVFLTKIISLFLGFFITVLTAGVQIARYDVIDPINEMAAAAGTFAYNSAEARADSLGRIRELDIRTGDEIENLHQALIKTTEDTVGYITEAQKKNEVISKLQNGLILVLADLVESRDQCTGDHVRKTAAYTRLIMEQMKKDGVYPDQLTDSFMSDVVDSAPLHDVGKIAVSDVLLNKPGKLTDEEFSQMRRHTTSGAEIISRAIDIVSEEDSGYLKEARNLAAYHHERWDGKGYPTGLAGEAIPLSARIMAVADVFDALVSKRSYKPPFTIEKAMDIIREGSGTHFDPKIAECFLRAEAKVREVAEQHMD